MMLLSKWVFQTAFKYFICDLRKGDQCLQSDISKLTASAARQLILQSVNWKKMKSYILKPGKGRNTVVCLTEKGKSFAAEKIYPLFEIENKIWNEWTDDEQHQYLMLTQKYRDALKKYLSMIQ